MRLVSILVLVLQLSPLAGEASKLRGLIFTGPASAPFEEADFTAMRAAGADHVALVPEATIDRTTLEIRHSFEHQWYGETRAATVEGIQLARRAGLEVMLKPHLAVSGRGRGAGDRTTVRGDWRGELDVADERDWPRLASEYRDFVLEFARLAEENRVEIFCVGTELKRLALARPDYWRDLAREVRRVYGGELVYAANWDSFERIEFWDALDYVGVDAYFPVSDAAVPTPEEVEAGWSDWVRRLRAVSDRFDRPVLLTEWGYEREEHPGREPWILGGGGPRGATAQANAYEGTFRALWNEPWLRGLFVWRWSPRAGEPGRYSPRGADAEKVLRRWFGVE